MGKAGCIVCHDSWRYSLAKQFIMPGGTDKYQLNIIINIIDNKRFNNAQLCLKAIQRTLCQEMNTKMVCSRLSYSIPVAQEMVTCICLGTIFLIGEA